LLDKVEINTVVIPYIDLVDKAVVMTVEVANSKMSDQFTSFIRGIPEWFIEHGARRVIQVKSGDGDSTPGIFSRERPLGNDSDMNHSSTMTFINGKGKIQNIDKSGIVDAEAGCCWNIELESEWETDWALIPYVANASDNARDRIIKELTGIVGVSPEEDNFADEFLEKAKDKDLCRGFIKKIKSAYVR
jgi:hypothetical protein